MYESFLEEIGRFIFAELVVKGNVDIIFVPGNRYPQNAENAAACYKKLKSQKSPYILVSGKYSIMDKSFLGAVEKQEQYSGSYETEADFLRDVLIKNGVEREQILLEKNATYTYQNALFSREITDRMGLDVKRAVICCRNAHARRCLMYYQQEYPDAEFMICPSVIDGISKENWRETQEGIELVMGEAQRFVQQYCLYLPKEKK